jgi:transposase
MAKAAKDLPENIDALKALVISKDHYIAVLEEQLQLLMHKRFGASSEKASADQLNMFNEAEAASETPAADDSETTVPEHKRKKPGRRPLPADLPRVVVEHDIPEDQKVCACGCRKTRIGQETSEQLDIIPPKAQVLQHVRYKYACPDCEGVEDDGPTVTIAPSCGTRLRHDAAAADPQEQRFAGPAGLYRHCQILGRPAAVSACENLRPLRN